MPRITLKGNESVTWKNIQASYIFMKTVSLNFNLNDKYLFDELTFLKKNIVKANLKCGVS